MKHFKHIALAVLISGSSASVLAQEDLLSIYKQAVSQDPTLARSQLQKQLADNQVKGAFGRLLPSVGASIRYGTSGGDSNNNGSIEGSDFELEFKDNAAINYDLTLNQVIFNKAALDGYSAVKVNANIAQLNTQAQQQTLIYDVATAYLGTLNAKEALATNQARLTAAQRQLQQTEKRYEFGLVAITDVQTATANADAVNVAVLRSKSAYQQANLALTMLTGKVHSELAPLNPQFSPEVDINKDQATWLEFAQTNANSIRTANLAVQQQKLTVSAKKALLLPSLSARVSYGYTDGLMDDGNGNADSSSFTLGLNLDIPIYNGGQRYSEINADQLNLEINQQQLIAAKRSLNASIQNLYQSMLAEQANIQAQQLALTSSQTAYKAAQVGYEQGTRNIVELLTAESQVFDAQLALSRARYDFIDHQLNLQKTAGVLSLKNLTQLNGLLITTAASE